MGQKRLGAAYSNRTRTMADALAPAGRGSTLYVDFHTTKPIFPAAHCHLNVMVADTHIPYRSRGLPAKYFPDFLVVTDNGQNVVVEIKGEISDSADAKVKAAQRSGARATNSAACILMESGLAVAQRVSILTFRPMIQADWASPCKNAANQA